MPDRGRAPIRRPFTSIEITARPHGARHPALQYAATFILLGLLIIVLATM